MTEANKEKMMQIIENKKQRKPFRFGGPGFLQFFAGDGDDDPGDDDPGDDDPGDDDPGDDDNPGDDDPGDDIDFDYGKGSIDKIMQSAEVDFGQLLKDNPGLKKQYQARFNKNMSKRMDKYADVDVEEYRDLKQRAEEGKLEGDAQVWKDKYEEAQEQLTQTSQRTAIQDYALGENMDQEQIAFLTTMIKTNKLEKDDEGEWMGIDDEVERIVEKFPRMFDSKDQQSDDDDDDDDQSDSSKKKQKYNAGTKKHNNNKKEVDRKERGRLRALERHKKNQK